MLTLVAYRQLQILSGRLLCFLDKSVQQDHPSFLVDVEKYSGDAVLSQTCPDFTNAAA
jgi:hypothetical protein